MSKGDLIVERGAERLQHLARRAARRGDGIGEWLADELTNDAAFLRKLKPSLIAARARGQAPTDTQPTAPPSPHVAPAAEKRAAKSGTRKGPPPVVVVGIALAAGIVAAKLIDWRGHAHPRN
jgi:hypothetical protein